MTYYKPTEWTVSHKPDNTCFMKLICDKTKDEKVIGFHVLGDHAGEITQGVAIAIKYVPFVQCRFFSGYLPYVVFLLI